ncbi:TPA: hypothetical protein ACH7RO_003888 [Escherichia coli]|uniref:hypothetical protein n=1 Tax=Escherichia coli TaxID=562 RepID=UPI000BEA1047|nr:hypothetical protein [Escherichia coli]EFH6224945.1 hypothetical protein [Escherichia coli]EFN5813171.1 hypothetical protein [Escherichia coli]EGO4191855.1 hypothetical protein [Escherichia coli]EHH8134027.1 hypothetical protein [Escherichia coli]EJA1187119.1 hypothetical protein [Escherichia coli]
MAIHDAGMFTVKEINRLKILQDVIERNLRLGHVVPGAKIVNCSARVQIPIDLTDAESNKRNLRIAISFIGRLIMPDDL